MNNKYFVGTSASSFKDLGESDPVEGVILFVDEEHQYTAGNPGGYVWELENPFGTQQMADDIFATLKGKTVLGYQASKAELPPEAELGDGVTIAGVYSQIAYRQVKFGPSHFSDISLPLEGKTSHEYQQSQTRETRELERKFARTRSYIEKKADEVRIGVEGTVDKLSSDMIVSVEAEYYLSDSPTALSGGKWGMDEPVWQQGKYIWTRQLVTYGDGTSDYSPSESGVCITGNTGASGESGAPGAPGKDGAAGVGVSTVTPQYFLSTSSASATGGSWSDVLPASIPVNQYLWTRSKVTYTNGDVKYTTGYNMTTAMKQSVQAELSMKVGRDENDQIVSMLNASADQINIRGNRFVLDSDNFKVAADGTITAKNGQFAGQVSSSGTWPDGVHTLLINDSQLNISIGSKRNLSIGQAAVVDGAISGSYISVYRGDNDNGVLLDDDARRTDVYGSQVHVGVDKNGVAKGLVSCGSLTSSGAITADGNVSAEGAISAGGNVTADGSVSAGGSISAGGNITGGPITAKLGDLTLSLRVCFSDGTVGLYCPEIGKCLVTTNKEGTVILHGIANEAEKVSHALTFTGGATGSYDGSAAKTVKIPSAAADVGALPISGGTLTGNLTLQKDQPYIYFTNTPGGSDRLGLHWWGSASGANTFGIYDVLNNVHLFMLEQSSKKATLAGDLAVGTGNNKLTVGNKAEMRTDSEGGNIRITSPSGAIYAEMDCWNNSAFRIYIHSNAGDFQGFNIGTNSSSTFIRGSADRVANALTFTGGATGSYNGSAAKTVKIPHIVTGVVTITPPNTNQNYQTVNFASGTFSSAPRMFLQLAGSAISKIFLGITSATKDSFQIAYARTDSASAFNVHWMAVEGMG